MRGPANTAKLLAGDHLRRHDEGDRMAGRVSQPRRGLYAARARSKAS